MVSQYHHLFLLQELIPTSSSEGAGLWICLLKSFVRKISAAWDRKRWSSKLCILICRNRSSLSPSRAANPWACAAWKNSGLQDNISVHSWIFEMFAFKSGRNFALSIQRVPNISFALKYRYSSLAAKTWLGTSYREIIRSILEVFSAIVRQQWARWIMGILS